ncbi:FHA domain-containing protein [Azospirillum sp. B510]|uniref:type VI secretion system-associated FHA domain protein n=1 Tax=Azospirillum sp. (strain B510) TaxID=137722 RepID=UPI0001C4C100|nr:FHA domain-containing protein [Azospirillum sp. B510]BAI72416.1 FHA domain-containing protein [Azospirillum sp. B510]
MKLRLTLVQCPPSQGGDIARDLGGGRLVIGRGPDCDWVLHDPDRTLSKTHCMVEFKGGVYVVIDSSTNGVFLNESPTAIGRGNSAVVGEGDRLRMGGFVMRAGFAAEEAPPANDPFLAVLRGADAPARPAVAEDDPFAPPAFGRGPVPVMPIPDDEDLFGRAGDRRSGGTSGGWQPTAAADGRDADWPGSAQPDFAPDSLGTIRVAAESPGFGSAAGAGGMTIPEDWLDEPLDTPPFPPPAIPSVGSAHLPDDWADAPLVPPAFGNRPTPAPAADPLARALADVVLSLVRQQAALDSLLGLDPEETRALGDSPLLRAADGADALARLRALPPAEAEALLRSAASAAIAHQSALLAAVRELAGETADGGARLAALYRRLLPVHRHALGG